MAYSTLAPTLSALNSVLATPADTELASAWPAVDRQTRNWLYDFLTTYFDPTTNQLLPAAIGNGTVPIGSVYGTNPQSGAQRQIVQGSIQSQDLAAGCITTSAIAANAITASQIAAGAVGTNQLANGAVTSAKLAASAISGGSIAPGSITAAAMGTGSVTASAIVAQAITNALIGVRAVDGSQLPQCSPGQMLVGGQSVAGQPNCVAPLTISGAITIDVNGVATLQSQLTNSILSFARVAEVGAPGTSCGPSNDTHAYGGGNTGTQGYAATYTPWQGRGLGQSNSGSYGSVSWSKILDPANLLTISDTVLTTGIVVGSNTYNTFQRPVYVNQQCVLMVICKIPGHNCGSHRLRLVALQDPTQPQNFQQYWGTSEVCTPASGSGVTGGDYMTSSFLTTLIAFKAPAGASLPYFYIDWFAQTASSTGMGLATGLGGNEYYGDITVVRLA